MKIVIDGSQSTGKTTLLLETKKYLGSHHNIYYIEEMAGHIASQYMNVKSSKDWERLLNNMDDYKYFVSLLTEKQKTEELKTPFLSDSSLYRIYAYAIENGLEVSQKDLENIRYDLVFYCPIEFDFLHNDFRTEHFRENVDKRLLELIKKFHKGKLVLLKGSIENRRTKILEELSHLF